MSSTNHEHNFKDMAIYSTDINTSWKQKRYDSSYSLFEIIKEAIKNKSNIIVKTSTGSWYIKNIGLHKSKKEIIEHIKKNISINFKPKSKIYFIEY